MRVADSEKYQASVSTVSPDLSIVEASKEGAWDLVTIVIFTR